MNELNELMNMLHSKKNNPEALDTLIYNFRRQRDKNYKPKPKEKGTVDLQTVMSLTGLDKPKPTVVGFKRRI